MEYLTVGAVVIASLLAVIGNSAYLWDVWRGEVLPHPYTWFIWSIVSLTTFLGGVQKGAGLGAIPTGVAEGFTILIFLISLRQLRRGALLRLRSSDHWFLGAALLGLIPWALTRDPTASVVIVVFIDLVAFIPTLQKTWRHPESEQPLLYGMNVGRHILTLSSLGSYNIATTIHSIAMICSNTLMVIFSTRKRALSAQP